MSAVDSEAARKSPDTAEKPVREQLQKASIDATAQNGDTDGASAAPIPAKKGENNSQEEMPSADDTAAADEKVKEDTVTGPAAATRGRTQRKRSFDESVGAPQLPSERGSRQGRKRSRDSTLGTDETATGNSSGRTSGESVRDADAETTTDAGNGAQTDRKVSGGTPPTEETTDSNGKVMSPKNKRTRVAENKNDASLAPRAPETDKQKIVVNGADPPSKADPTAKKDDTTPKEKTSASAFASSGFGAFASSASSGFGSLSEGKKLSSFASPEPEAKPAAATKPSTSTFGGALGQTSAFGLGGTGSAFGGSSSGGFGGGFGSGGGGGGGFGSAFAGAGGTKLSTFATTAGTALGTTKKPVRAFGAPADADEEASEGEGEDDEVAKIKSPKNEGEDKQDERFFRQDLATGEEHEKTEYTCRAKLYNFVATNPADAQSKKEWKERGLGTLRLNVLNNSDEEADIEAGETKYPGSGVQARLVMRADGSHRVILNTPIKKELRFGTVTGDAPQNGYVYFMGSIDGSPKLELLQLKMRQQFAGELYEHISELKKDM